jgi:2-polyprenyl-3-methyl-5-hydroxy-6-metoxy-1,4-benzoquinol methylase
VKLFSLVPTSIRGILCRLCFSAAGFGDPKKGLIELLSYQNVLGDEIDKCAIKHNGGVHPKIRLIDYPSFFVKRISKGEKVLDVGCAFGLVSRSMAEAGAIVTGIDFNENYLRMAREKNSHPNLTYVLGDVTSQIPPGEYDTVVLSNVLEHIKDRVGLIQSIIHQINPKRWLIRVPLLDRDWVVYLKREVGIPYLSDATHYVEYTVDSFSKEMAACNLQIQNMETSFGEIRAELSLLWSKSEEKKP